MAEVASPPAELTPVVLQAQRAPTPPDGARRNSVRRRSSGVSSADQPVVLSQPRRRSLGSYEIVSGSNGRRLSTESSSSSQPGQSMASSTFGTGRPRRASAGQLDGSLQAVTLVVSAGVPKWEMGKTCCVSMTKANMRRLVARLQVLATSFREENKTVILQDDLSKENMDAFEAQCAQRLEHVEARVEELESMERRCSTEEMIQHRLSLKASQDSKRREASYRNEISRLTAQLEKIEKKRAEYDRERLALELRYRVMQTTTSRHAASQTDVEDWLD
eukprot:gnl/MRDRNA2_/MRDRNA2_91896_c0_seq1.p1 gnl/MRDRNA2_/MRDRNA2_91896_c0~~gnl/MRDRNA2_/MRDRNA2_91896_c0_seq1.p1  ORF type:complete len:289 (-),score=59.80 gnl/MRDRNA2_/MRDRNA2_91896_c0_seq1:84-911(-)